MTTIMSTDMPGDVQLGALFKIWDSQNQICSSISVPSVRSYEAAKWTLKILNAMDYVPGIDIGTFKIFHLLKTTMQKGKVFLIPLTSTNDMFCSMN